MVLPAAYDANAVGPYAVSRASEARRGTCKEKAGRSRPSGSNCPVIEPASLLADEDIDRCATEIPALAYLVFEEALVGVFYILRQVGKEDERRYARVGQLGDIFDFDVLALV